MPKPKTPQRTIAKLLKELEAAVRAKNRAKAERLERAILQRLVKEAADRAGVERRVRALMAKLNQPPAAVGLSDEALLFLAGQTDSEGRGGGGWGSTEEDSTGSGLTLFKTQNVSDSIRPPRRIISGLASFATTKGEVFPVWFGTNRKPTANGDGFTGERHDQITRGRVDVFVPEAHKFGETGSSLLTKLWRLDLRSDKIRVQSVKQQERDAFFKEIQQTMQNVKENGVAVSHALLFIHGFNVPFEEAAIRAAQLTADLKVPGATAFFSWPSRGNVVDYPVDEATIEASEKAITDFLVDFTANCGAEKVHIIAHSMGNRGLLRAMQRIAANAETQGKVKFGQIFLAAPDVDRELFLDLAYLYPKCSERTTLYASDADLPVHLSAKFHDAPRAGYFLPYTVVPNMDTVTVPDFDIDLLGHSYFAQAEALLYDIRDLMLRNESPAQRQRIKSATHKGLNLWELQK